MDKGEVDEAIPLGVHNVNAATNGPIWGSNATYKIKGDANSNPKSKITFDRLKEFHGDYDIPGMFTFMLRQRKFGRIGIFRGWSICMNFLSSWGSGFHFPGL